MITRNHNTNHENLTSQRCSEKGGQEKKMHKQVRVKEGVKVEKHKTRNLQTLFRVITVVPSNVCVFVSDKVV